MLRSIILIATLSSISTARNVCPTYFDNTSDKTKDNTSATFICKSNEEDCLCIFKQIKLKDLEKLDEYRKHAKFRTRKVIVRKRQIGDLETCGGIQPPKPGKASCTISRRAISCIGVCDKGYIFSDGSMQLLYACNFANGLWKPKATYPSCVPTCKPKCINNGNCTAVNFCSCPNDYRGNICQYPISLCGVTKNMQPSSWQCNHTTTETVCDISCHPPGSQESERESQRYKCNIAGQWSPVLPPCVITPRCQKPSDIKNGMWESSSGEYFSPDVHVTYTCDEGFSPVGSTEITCLANSTWSSSPPKCVVSTEMLCSKPSAPKNAQMFITIPDPRPQRNFQGADISFLQTMHPSNLTRGYVDADATSEFPAEASFPSGTRVQYRCRSRFYKLYGSTYQTCLSGIWTGYQPTCLPECGKSDSPRTPFIVNGNSTTVGQWPWQVGLGVFQPNRLVQLICGAVLISETWVLTAAHCVTKKNSNIPMNPEGLLLFCGKYFRGFDRDDEYVQAKQVRQIVVHEDYDFLQYDSDIALLQLASPVVLTARVRSICLPTEENTRHNIRDGREGIVLGWGLTEKGEFSESLRETKMPVVGYERCEEAYKENHRSVTVTANMFCAGHDSGFSDTCTGDSGGPFIFPGLVSSNRWVLEGLVSWGSESGCGKAQRYSGFTKIGRFVPWINLFI